MAESQYEFSTGESSTYIVFPANVAYYRRDNDDICEGGPSGLRCPAEIFVSMDVHVLNIS